MSDDVSLVDSDDEVICRVCNKTFGQITASHLSRHGMTTAEYQEEYPDAPIQSKHVQEQSGWSGSSHGDEARDKISEAIRQKHENGEYDNADER